MRTRGILLAMSASLVLVVAVSGCAENVAQEVYEEAEPTAVADGNGDDS